MYVCVYIYIYIYVDSYDLRLKFILKMAIKHDKTINGGCHQGVRARILQMSNQYWANSYDLSG